MRVEDFDYYLPEELIAQVPIEPRDAARLMVLSKESGKLEHRVFSDLPDLLRPDDLLVLNDTRVIPARLIGVREDTGGKVEVLLLTRRGLNEWETLVKPGRRVKVGTKVVFGEGRLVGEVLAKTEFGGRLIRFSFTGESFEAVLDELGEMPLPPYIHRQLDDPERYQTVYARESGSAAAPTAGLHFTPQLMERLKQRGIEMCYVTLHVGLGTFRPVNVERVEEHVMHAEFYRLPAETAEAVNRAKQQNRRVIAVGTTSTRALEAAAVRSLPLQPHEGWTDIFIYPGYEFKVIDGLITNFHLPKSTLLMLVSALAGREQILHAYEVAVQERYRFFSLGDAMLII